MASVGEAGGAVKDVRLCRLLDNGASGVGECVRGGIDAGRGIVSTNDVRGRLVPAKRPIINVDKIVVGIADGRRAGMNLVAENKAPKRQSTYMIMFVSRRNFVIC